MKRYPFAPLAAAMGESVSAAGRILGLSGSTRNEYRDRGVTERVADRLAVKAGLNPYEVWPEMVDDLIADAEVECARTDCTVRFVPTHHRARFCCRNCKDVDGLRRRRQRPEVAAAARRSAAAYYAEHGDYVRAQRRRRWHAARSARPLPMENTP